MSDTIFLRTFQNSILLVVCVTVITMALSLIFAAIISREKIKGENFFRVIFYIPNILSIVIISAIFSAIYDPNTGLLNSVISIFRGDNCPYLAGNRLLYGYVYGKYGKRTGEPLRICRFGRRKPCTAILFHYTAFDLD